MARMNEKSLKDRRTEKHSKKHKSKKDKKKKKHADRKGDFEDEDEDLDQKRLDYGEEEPANDYNDLPKAAVDNQDVNSKEEDPEFGAGRVRIGLKKQKVEDDDDDN